MPAKPDPLESSTAEGLHEATLRPKAPNNNLVFVISRQQSKRRVPVDRVPRAGSGEATADYAVFTKALKSGKEAKYYDSVVGECVPVFILRSLRAF